jgi:hypothetical protein
VRVSSLLLDISLGWGSNEFGGRKKEANIGVILISRNSKLSNELPKFVFNKVGNWPSSAFPSNEDFDRIRR